ncbi:MAG: hypothetical protein HYV32_00270 [Candidatus Kerfeldbacteria bacterium]|nr:hypothetical protein [Candidatus Kerfeldbacteria bacterium]
MILLRRIIPFCASLYLIALFFGLFLRGYEWRVWVAQMAALIILSIGSMVEWKFRSKDFWLLAFPLVSLLAGGVGLLFFLNTTLTIVILASALVIAFGVYLESVFTYRYQPQKYTQLSLPNISLFINTFSGFSIFATAYAVNLINLLPDWAIPLIAFGFTLAMMIHIFWGYKIEYRPYIGTIFLVALLMAELTWVLHFWPTTFFVNGIIMAIALYSVPSLIHLRLREILTKQLVIQYSIVSLLAILFVMMTSQWI